MTNWILTLKQKRLWLGATALGLAASATTAACAADGLQTPGADATWPQWQARLSLQAGALSPLTLSGLNDPTQLQRGLPSATLLGDYYFARQTQGGFRASGGLLVGPQIAAPSGLKLLPGTNEGLPLSTYLGLGYSTLAFGSSLSLSADLGLIAERPGNAWGAARALFGNSGTESALREMRLSPLMQLGLRYTF